MEEQKPKLDIAILSFDGCPSQKSALNLVRRLVREHGVKATIRAVDVPDGKAAIKYHFFGSPTIQVNGVDVEPSMRNVKEYGLACRLYMNKGTMRGMPPAEMVEKAILEAAKQSAK